MSKKVLTVTDDNFEQEVIKSSKPIIVDFWAEWCGPCKALAPKVEELANKYDGKIKVVKLNIDDSPDTPAKFGVRGIPTLILFKNGKPIDTLVGNQPDEKLEELADKGL